MGVYRGIRIAALAAATAATAAAVLLLADESRSGSKSRCSFSGTTITANKTGVVYRRGSAREYDAYVCVFSSARTRALGSFDEIGAGVYGFRLAGRFLAYDHLDCLRESCDGEVRVLDLGTGKTRKSAPTQPGGGLATDLELTSTGAVAWIRAVTGPGTELKAMDRAGERVLDSGSEIDRASLAVSGSTLYWTRAGAPKSAALD